jgi:SAM-dependent methyltransferase
MQDQAQTLWDLLDSETASGRLVKAVLSVPRESNATILNIKVRRVDVRGERQLQFTSQSRTQQFHKNLPLLEAAGELLRLAKESFRNVHLTTETHQWEARFSKKEKCLLRKQQLAPATVPTMEMEHNRKRNYLIPEGTPVPFLVHSGVMTKEGAVRASHARKFRQINRFLEFLQDIVDFFPNDRPVRVVDFGCGKSYLTFATHYLLTTILNRPCRITGLDRRQDVVDTCTQIVAQLGIENLSFQVGDIAGYQCDEEVDVVVSLHACDTATDDAIAQAVKWNCRAILAVPCCQHELNAMLNTSALPPVTSFGITKERFASIATDTMRGELLKAIGYQTQILEFIETEHTPKNLLIRAVRDPESSISNAGNKKAVADVRSTRNMLGVPPLALERQLADMGKIER